VNLIDSLRFETAHLPLSEIVDAVIQRSGLIQHYQTEREGQERIENLNELVNAAAAFISEEGYAQDAPATQASAEESATRSLRRWPRSSRMPRSRPATTRPRRARTRCS
jgi:DNA helicase-2/ATP-dependent DNA helicase PcrA